MEINQLKDIAGKETAADFCPPDNTAVEASVSYLSSPAAMQSLDEDPYWPKWCGPWWQMLLLYELNLASLIPKTAIERMLCCLDNHYLKFFPFKEEEIPAGRDPVRHIACHCALGTMHQVLNASGVDVDKNLPWIRPWYMRYQLEDGGLNCDEAAYTRCPPKSSIVSSLPPMEAMLSCTPRNFTVEEIEFLDRGAGYLIERRLIRSASSGRLIDAEWLKLCFPRFYHYDQLRGLNFLLNWAVKLRRRLPLKAVQESIALIDGDFPDGLIRVQRSVWVAANSSWLDRATGEWIKAPAGSFPLLEHVSQIGVPSQPLTKAWSQAKSNLSLLAAEDLIGLG